MTKLLEHFEKYLGQSDGGWSKDIDGYTLPFYIMNFPNTTLDGVKAIATLGLSNFPLRINKSERRLREELFIMYREIRGPYSFTSILQRIAFDAIASDTAYYVNDIIPLPGAIFHGSLLQGFYLTTPTSFDEDFELYNLEGGGSVVIGWLVPVAINEINYIVKFGPDSFEKKVNEVNVDLLDIYRDSII